jgi:hypothetical protein
MMAALEIADIDFMDSPSWDESMHDRLRWLRENDPVSWSPATNAFIITKFDDVSAVSRNQEVFTSDRDLAYAEWGRGAAIMPSALVRNHTEMQITFTPR